VHSHGHNSPTPGLHHGAPLCSSGSDAGTGSSRRQGRLGCASQGSGPNISNFPSSLPSLYLTHADPPTPAGLAPLPRASALFFWPDWGVFIRDCHLSNETLVALRMGGSSPYIQELGTCRALPSSNPSPRLQPDPKDGSCSSQACPQQALEGTKLKHRLLHRV